jgi:hypothetical protein
MTSCPGAVLRAGSKTAGPPAEQRCVTGIESQETTETDMTFGRGLLLWLIGIPLPIILLLALFWR